MDPYSVTDVATKVLSRCAVTNEGQRLTREGERVTREDENFKITLDYEFLEDFEYHTPGKLKRAHSIRRLVAHQFCCCWSIVHVFVYAGKVVMRLVMACPLRRQNSWPQDCLWTSFLKKKNSLPMVTEPN